MSYLNLFLLLITFLTFSSCQTPSWLPKIVWTYWEDPLTDNDQLLMSFSKNHQEMLKGWEIRHMNRDNMWKWLNEIPGLKDNFFGQQFQSQVNAKRADLIRLAIMHHYGGVWMDFTMILTENLDWILDLKNNQLVQNKYGDNPDIFVLYSSQHGDKDEAFDKETNQKFMLYPTFQIFFMAAKPGNQFAKDWMDYFVQVVKNSYKKYGTENKSWLLDYARQQSLKIGGFAEGWQKYFECSISSSVLLQKSQEQLDIKNQKDKSKQRQIAVKNYKIWLMGTAGTAFTIHNMANFELKHIVSILAQTQINYLKTSKFYPRYFVKIYHQILYYLRLYLMSQQLFSQITCPQSYFILQNSILYEYLLKYNMKFYSNLVTKVSFNRNCITPIDFKQYIRKQKELKELKQKQAQKKEEQQIKYTKLAQQNPVYYIISQKNEELYSRLKKMVEERMSKQTKQAEQILYQQKNIFQQQLKEKQQRIGTLQKKLIDSEGQVNFHKLLNQIISACLLISSITFLIYYCANRTKGSALKKPTYVLEQIDKQQNSFRSIIPSKEAE